MAAKITNVVFKQQNLKCCRLKWCCRGTSLVKMAASNEKIVPFFAPLDPKWRQTRIADGRNFYPIDDIWRLTKNERNLRTKKNYPRTKMTYELKKTSPKKIITDQRTWIWKSFSSCTPKEESTFFQVWGRIHSDVSLSNQIRTSLPFLLFTN